jgi:hypothetical protein
MGTPVKTDLGEYAGEQKKDEAKEVVPEQPKTDAPAETKTEETAPVKQ